jgi:hypothetical protein
MSEGREDFDRRRALRDLELRNAMAHAGIDRRGRTRYERLRSAFKTHPSSEADVALARFERLLMLIPARMVPRRVQTEVVGDAFERLNDAVRAGGSKWVVRFVYTSVILTVCAEIVRYWARALKGERARK